MSIENSLYENNLYETSLVVNSVLKDRLLLEFFCAKYNVTLVNLSVDLENSDLLKNRVDFKNNFGLMYFFSDNFGGYTRAGLKASLVDK